MNSVLNGVNENPPPDKIQSLDLSANNQGTGHGETVKPKRKKTSRACSHCQKSHMTCDSNRPCTRCIQRGLSTTCEDAPRKRKKYLGDIPMNALSQPLYRSTTNDDSASASAPDLYSQPLTQRSNTTPYTKSEYSPLVSPAYNLTENGGVNGELIKKRTKFLSSAADLEYSTLSNIISDNFLNPSTSNENTPSSLNRSPVMSPHVGETSPNNAINDAFIINPLTPQTIHNVDNNNANVDINTNRIRKIDYPSFYDANTRWDKNINQYFLGIDNDKIVLYPEIAQKLETQKTEDFKKYYENIKHLEISFSLGILPENSAITRISESQNDLEHYFQEPEDIYEKVNKPYSYTPGYHSLIAYLRKRFNKEMLVKMAETMASYRPSFIACTNSLKEHDLIFMEQCFQRTLLTYDSIIKVSGTPTIVWRRTGEIAYVGNEFCILTGWNKEELLGHRKTFIVELLDDKSVLEYFQLFLKIAFGDFFGATMSECTLLSKNPSVQIRTRCSWTLKRDVFGIPMMIIGNFLPIP